MKHSVGLLRSFAHCCKRECPSQLPSEQSVISTELRDLSVHICSNLRLYMSVARMRLLVISDLESSMERDVGAYDQCQRSQKLYILCDEKPRPGPPPSVFTFTPTPRSGRYHPSETFTGDKGNGSWCVWCCDTIAYRLTLFCSAVIAQECLSSLYHERWRRSSSSSYPQGKTNHP